MSENSIFEQVNNQTDFISIEHEMLEKWAAEETFTNSYNNRNHWCYLRIGPDHASSCTIRLEFFPFTIGIRSQLDDIT